ncbi:MAG: hypothetical protein F6K26_23235 [Moorea sp. SIO2I5]|nr:hypothetical protein [Moorena sp. SIO2I5]
MTLKIRIYQVIRFFISLKIFRELLSQGLKQIRSTLI